MIVVVGRPAILARSAPGPRDDAAARPAGLVARIAIAAAAARARVEVVGTIGDDEDGDALTVALSRSGVGHAALLRDPSARTPLAGATTTPGVTPRAAEQSEPAEWAPRLEAADVELGLRYHADYRVLVLAEPIPEDAERVALDAASFQGAAVIAIVPPGGAVSDRLSGAGTVLEAPGEGNGAFADLVGRYAAALDAGEEPQVAFASARRATGWESGPT
jgi:sugar/nucleoside kinase (ribokinase family)